MSPTLRKAFQNVALALVVGAAGTGAVLGWKKYGGVNPYAEIESHQRPSDPASAFVAKGVQIRHYEKGKLVARTDAKDLTMSQDRNSLTLTGIKNGMVDTAKGPVQFEGGVGILRPNLKMVDVSNGVRVKGKGFEFQTSQANIDGRQGQISMPQPLSGKIAGGDFIAKQLTYVPNTEYAHLKNVVFRGQPPKGMGLPVGNQEQAWDIAAEDVEQVKGLVRTYLDARAENKDCIVMAPKVVEDAKNNVLTATGRATYRSAKADIVADKVVVYRKEKRAIFTGNVVMLVRPKKDWDKPLPKNEEPKPTAPAKATAPKKDDASDKRISPQEKERDEQLRSGKTLRDYPMNLKAAEVTYWYGDGDRHAIAKGGDPTAYQTFDDGRWREMKAPEAHYDGEKDLLDLFSEGPKIQVKYKNSIGDWGNANWLQLTTKEDASEDEEEMKSKKPNFHYIDRDPDNATKPADGKKPPVTAPPTKTEPPVKTGP